MFNRILQFIILTFIPEIALAHGEQILVPALSSGILIVIGFILLVVTKKHRREMTLLFVLLFPSIYFSSLFNLEGMFDWVRSFEEFVFIQTVITIIICFSLYAIINGIYLYIKRTG